MDIDARRESGVADLHAFDFVLNQETAPAAMHRGNIRLRDAQSEAVPVERPCRSAARHAPRGEEFAVRPTIPRDQPGRLRLGMRPDQEVHQNPRPLATLLAIGAPRPARQEVSFPGQWLASNLIPLKKGVAFALRREVGAKLGIHQIAHNKRPRRFAAFSKAPTEASWNRTYGTRTSGKMFVSIAVIIGRARHR